MDLVMDFFHVFFEKDFQCHFDISKIFFKQTMGKKSGVMGLIQSRYLNLFL